MVAPSKFHTSIKVMQKRIIACILTVLMIFSMIPERAFADETSSSNILFTSDIHGETENLNTWLDNAKKDGIGAIDYMCFGGDYTAYFGGYNDSIFASCNDILQTHFNGVRGIFSVGNHEYDGGGFTNESLQTKAGCTRTGVQAIHDNYIIYNFGAASSVQIIPDSDILELETFLDNLDEQQKKIPVFIVSHYPLHHYKSRTTQNAKKVIDLLNQYPNTVFMWGHNHSQTGPKYGDIDLAGDSIQYASGSFAEINFSYVNLGSMRDGAMFDKFGLVVSVTREADKIVVDYQYRNLICIHGDKKTVDYSLVTTINKTQYQLVTDLSEGLEIGAEYVIVVDGYAVTSNESNSTLAGSEVDLNEDGSLITSNVTDDMVFTCAAGSSDNSFSFLNEGKYLYRISSSRAPYNLSMNFEHKAANANWYLSAENELYAKSSQGSDLYYLYLDNSVFRVSKEKTTPVSTVSFYKLVKIEKTVTGLEIIASPTKLDYIEGEDFDATGMVVKVNYGDGSSEVVTDYTCSPNSDLSVDNSTITISYGGHVAFVTVQVKPAPIKYQRVDGLEVGADYVIVVDGYAITSNKSSSTLAGKKVYPTEDGFLKYIDVTDDMVFTCEAGSTENSYNFKNESGYLYRVSGGTSNIGVKNPKENDVYVDWLLSGMKVLYTNSSQPNYHFYLYFDGNSKLFKVSSSETTNKSANAASFYKLIENEPIVTGIYIKELPTKTSYIEGETFDPTGMVVEKIYCNGVTEEITDYTYSPAEPLSVSDTFITISYGEFDIILFITVEIEDTEPIEPGIYITKPPTKTIYIEGEYFDPAGMVVEKVNSDETREVINDYDYSPRGPLFVTCSAITVSYEEYTAKVKISVVKEDAQPTVTGIIITSQPRKVRYTVGDVFNPAGMEVSKIYSDGTIEVLTDAEYDYSPKSSLKLSDSIITVRHGEYTATVSITVRKKDSGGYYPPPYIPSGPVSVSDSIKNVEPEIEGNSSIVGWDKIVKYIQEQIADSNSNEAEQSEILIAIIMNDATEVPKNVFEVMKGYNIEVVFKLKDGNAWIVNGNNITESILSDTDFTVTYQDEMLLKEQLEALLGAEAASKVSARQFSLMYNEKMGYNAILSLDLKHQLDALKENESLQELAKIDTDKIIANLFSYDKLTGEFILQSVDRVSADGKADFSLSDSSDYIVILSDKVIFDADTLAKVKVNGMAAGESINKTLYIGGTEGKSEILTTVLPDVVQEAIDEQLVTVTINYSSSDQSIAKTDSFGEVVAKKAGKATITATIVIGENELEYKMEVNVKKAYIKFTKSAHVIKIGKDVKFTVSIGGYDISKLEWMTSKRKIAVVKKNRGKKSAYVTGETKGTDYVYIRIPLENGDYVTKEVKVTVEASK